MKLERLPDGTVVLQTRLMLLRVAFLIGAALLLVLTVSSARDPAARDGVRIVASALGTLLLAFCFAVVETSTFRFDAAERQLVWSRRRAIGSKQGRIPFADVKDVFVLESVDRDDDSPRPHASYRLMLATAGGQIPLTSVTPRRREDFDAAVAAIRQALGLAAATGPRDDVVDLVAAGMLVEAIALVRRRKGLGLTEAHRVVEEMRARAAPRT